MTKRKLLKVGSLFFALALVLSLVIFAVPTIPAQASPAQTLTLELETWSLMSSGITEDLYGVWGSSSSDVFAVGGWGTILHYDGSAWSGMSSGTTEWLYGVWGSSSSDVFAVGTDGTILHYDGSAWSGMSSGTTEWLYGVWGSSASDVFAVGDGGTILHYNGSAWSAMSNGSTWFLWGVWGSSSSDVFAVGWDGTILHYNGSAWSAMSSGTTEGLDGVWGSSASDVFAVGYGGTILHYLEQAPPTITSVNPNQGNQGATLDVTITGTNFTGASAVSFGAGITVNSFTVDSSTQITANISIDVDATTGARDVSVTTPGGIGMLTSGFTVVQPSPAQTLILEIETMTMVSEGPSRALTLQAGDEVVQFTRDNVTIPSGGVTGWLGTLGTYSWTVSGDLSGGISIEANAIGVYLPVAATQRLEPPEGQEPLADVDGFGFIVGKFEFDDGSGNGFSGIMAMDWDWESLPDGAQSVVRGYMVSTEESGDFSGQKLIGILAMKYNQRYDDPTTFEILGATITLTRYFPGEITSLGTTGLEGTPTASFTRLIPNLAGDTLLQFTRDNVTLSLDNSTGFGYGELPMTITGGPLTGTVSSEWNYVIYYDGLLLVDWIAGKFSLSDGNDTISGVMLLNDIPPFTEGYLFALSRGTTTGKYAGKEYFATLSGVAEDSVFTGSAEFMELSADTTPPAAITDLATSNPTSNSITLTWTAPGDDANTGTASQYGVRYSTSTITNANWDAATQCDGEPSPQAAGSSESFIATGLSPSTTYYFAVKAADEVPNWSGLSNVASGTTADTTPPAAITDLATSNPTSNSITLTWTAPGDDANTGTASQYDVRYSTSTITNANWDAATQCAGEPSPQAAGSSESFIVTGLSPSTTYYFAIKTADEVPNWSGLSNVASGTTTAAAPEADFSVSPTRGEAPLAVQFTDKSTGDITSWEWDFDNDGKVDSTQQNPSYTYETAGKYTVSLKVTGPGGEDIQVKSDYITVEEKEAGLFDCACGAQETRTSATELLIGWGIIGLCWGTAYYFVRRVGKNSRK